MRLMRPSAPVCVAIATLAIHFCAPQHLVAQQIASFQSVPLPTGATRLPFESLEGLILLQATMHGATADTSGLLVLDTGAGYLALDGPVAQRLGVVDHVATTPGVGLAQRPLPRFELGSLRIDYITPLLTIDGSIVRRVTDRPVLGLLGQRPFTGRAIIVDYRDELLTILPVPLLRLRSAEASSRILAPHFSPNVRLVPFDLSVDGKILVRASIADPYPDSMSAALTWIVDTGATRCVLFEESLRGPIRHHRRWGAMEGLSAPTLYGDEPARITSVPQVSIHGTGDTLREQDVETVIIGGPLAANLSSAIGERVDGLIGYSLLGRYRVGIDYVNRLLWLDPLPDGWEQRPYRYSQIGLQVERRDGALVVSGIVRQSPAEAAGIETGDEILVLAGTPSRLLDVASTIQRLEGSPGSSITLTLRRNGRLMTYKLMRRKLL